MKTFILVCALAAYASAQLITPYGLSPLVYSHPLLRIIPGAPLNPDGTVADTPEVTAAKINHFAAHHEALSRGKRWAPLNPDGTVADTPEVAAAKLAHYSEVAKAGGAVPMVYAPQWYAAGAIPDTPEVAAAKMAHFAAHARARGIVSPWWNGVYSPLWMGAAPLNADGTVADTPEVAIAKAAHFSEVAKARSMVSPLHVGISDTPEVAAAKMAHMAAHSAALSRGKRWAPLNPDGTVADTPEVAAAKMAHFAEVAKARGIVPIAPLIAHAPIISTPHYYGPAAPLNPDGTVAETPEVRAAKAVHFAARAGYTLPIHGLWSPVNADGSMADTPEVVAKKLEHFAAHGDALARLG